MTAPQLNLSMLPLRASSYTEMPALDGTMEALTTRLRLSSTPAALNLGSATAVKETSNNTRRNVISAFSRKNVGEKLFLTGTLRSSSGRRKKRNLQTLGANKDKEVSTAEEKITAADGSTGARSEEENKNGPPILTIIAGLIVLAGFLWLAASVLFWFIGLFFR
ncbi:hypothetical protein R1sor_007012 [Riccia sorocarpa]|uniref:Uncharacterized protein n=1 Tax=Riccia sorocarpa TaxID=122646 RepID=A0ABD3HR05_9MARC